MIPLCAYHTAYNAILMTTCPFDITETIDYHVLTRMRKPSTPFSIKIHPSMNASIPPQTFSFPIQLIRKQHRQSVSSYTIEASPHLSWIAFFSQNVQMCARINHVDFNV